MKKILVVDDEQNIRHLIKKYAEFEAYSVDEAAQGLEAVEKVRQHDYDIVVLDLMMPEMNGFDACRLIRETSQVPIIMLTARDSEFDKYQGFELGIDDYVIKPFSPKELMYRIEAILKRSGNGDADVYTYESLSLNYKGHRLSIDNQAIELSLKEYDLLVYLIKNRNIALERSQILNKVWGYDFYGDDRTLDTHIKRLRQKLGEYQHLIVTIRGVGYRFEDETK